MEMKKTVAVASMMLYSWWYSVSVHAQCTPDRVPPIFQEMPACDSAYCQGPLPSGYPPVRDNCSNPVLSEAPEIVGGTFQCNGKAFLVYGPQDMPDVRYVLSQHRGVRNGEDTTACGRSRAGARIFLLWIASRWFILRRWSHVQVKSLSSIPFNPHLLP